MTAEKLYSINFTKQNTKFCLSLHYNGANSYLFVNSTKSIKFKAKCQVFNLIPRANETRHIKWHETCKCKCGLDTDRCL